MYHPPHVNCLFLLWDSVDCGAGLFQTSSLNLHLTVWLSKTSPPSSLPSHFFLGILQPPDGSQPVCPSGRNATLRLGPSGTGLWGWKPWQLTGSKCLHAGKIPSWQLLPWFHFFTLFFSVLLYVTYFRGVHQGMGRMCNSPVWSALFACSSLCLSFSSFQRRECVHVVSYRVKS